MKKRGEERKKKGEDKMKKLNTKEIYTIDRYDRIHEICPGEVEIDGGTNTYDGLVNMFLVHKCIKVCYSIAGGHPNEREELGRFIKEHPEIKIIGR